MSHPLRIEYAGAVSHVTSRGNEKKPAFRSLIRKPRTVILVTVQRLLGDSLVIDMLGEPELETLRGSLEGHGAQGIAGQQGAQQILAHYAWELRSDGVTVKKVIRDGPPAEEILKVAREEAVDLVIIGHGCKGFFSRLLKGSVSREIRKSGQFPFLDARTMACKERSTGRGTREWVKRGKLQPVATT